MASPDGNTGGNSTEAPSPAEAVKDRELSEEREGKEVGEADITEGVGGKGNRQAAGGEEDVVQKDDAGGNEHGDDAGKGNVQADDRASGKETGGPIENGEGLNATDKANAEESEKGLLRKQQTGGEESCEEDGEGIDATDKGKGEGSEKELLQGEQAGAKGVVGAQDGQPVAGAVSGPSGSAASEPVTSEPQSKGEAQGGATVTNSQPSVGFSFITDEEPPRGKRKQPDEKGPGRPKPCNACRKVRKGGCGTPRAYSGCEVWKPEVREWPRKRGEERELRPWPAHLPPEAHAQIQTVAADPSRADPNASTASRIPYLYFGRSPSEVDPGSENGAGVSPAPYSRLTPASYLSRLNQSSAVASGPPFVDLFAEPPSNWQARSGLVPNPGPGLLSQQVSQIFSPPHAALGSHQPGGPLLPQIAQLINFPPVGLHPVIGNGVRKPVPSGKASRAQNPQIAVSRHAGVPVKMLNPNGRTPDANPVVPLSNILPTRIQIPELPMFRNPPTASIGAQLPAPRLTISNQPLLGSFLRGPEPFTGAQTSTDVIRIRGGGSRPTEGKPSADVIRVQAGDPRPAEGQPPADVMRIRGGGPRSRKRKQTDGATGGEEKKARKVAGKKASEEKDGALEKERMAEGTAGGGNDAGVNAEERTGSKERVAERRAAEEGSSGVPPQREGLRRSSRVRKKTEVADQTAKTTSEAGVKGRRKSAAKVSMETSEMAGPSRQGDAHEKEALDGGKARRGRKGKVEATAERGKKATSEGKAEGKESKGRSKGAKKRKKGTDGEFGGVGTSAAKKARGGAKGKGGSGKAPLIVFAHGAGAGSSSPFMQR